MDCVSITCPKHFNEEMELTYVRGVESILPLYSVVKRGKINDQWPSARPKKQRVAVSNPGNFF